MRRKLKCFNVFYEEFIKNENQELLWGGIRRPQ